MGTTVRQSGAQERVHVQHDGTAGGGLSAAICWASRTDAEHYAAQQDQQSPSPGRSWTYSPCDCPSGGAR